MKASAEQYARVLLETLEGKSEKEAKKIIADFVVVLGKNRELNQEKEIIEFFQNIWDKEHGELPAELLSARSLDKTSKDSVVDYIKDKTEAKKVILEEKINKDIIGGFILRYNGKIIDGSLRNSLNQLKLKISS